jgi:hypothetical protein
MNVIAEVKMYKTEREIKTLENYWCGPRFLVTDHSPFEAMFNWALHAHTNVVG